MAISNTGVNIRFDADTRAAMSQMAALEARLNRLHNAMARKVGDAFFNTSGFEVRMNSQVRSMDDLTRSIQRGKLGYRDFMNTIRGTNGLLEYQQRLHRANLTSMRQLNNGQMMVGLDTRQIGATNAALSNQAVQLATSAAAARAYGNTMMNVGKNMAFMGRQALLSVTAPIAAIGAGSAVVFYQYDKQLTQIVKLTGDSTEVMKASANDIRQASLDLSEDLAKNFGVAVKETLNLQAQFAALGRSGKDLAEATESTARLMRLGDLDSDTALQFSNTMQTVFGQTNEELQKSIDLINEMENSTVLTMQDVSEAMPKIGPIVKSMGGDIKDVLVMLEALKRGGIPAVEAANAVKSITGSIFRPSKRLRDVYEEMIPGDSIMELAYRNNNNLIDIMKDLGNRMNELNFDPNQKLRLMFQLGGKEQAARLIQLADNLANANENVTRTLGKSAEELRQIADDEIKALMESASAQFDVQVQRALIFAQRIGAKVLPLITKGLGMVISMFERGAEVVGNFLEMLGPLGGLVKSLGAAAIIAAAAFGPLLLLMSAGGLIGGGLMKGWGQVTSLRARVANFRAGNGFTAPQMLTAQQAAEQRALEAQQQQQRESMMTTQQLEAAIRRLTQAYTGMTAAATTATGATARNANTAAASAAMMGTGPLRPPPAGFTGPMRSTWATENGTNPYGRTYAQTQFVGPPRPYDYRPPAPVSSSSTHTVGAASAARLAEQQERVAATAQKMAAATGVAAIGVGFLGSQMAGTNKDAQLLVTGLTMTLLAFSLFPGAVTRAMLAAGAKVKLFGSIVAAMVASSGAAGSRLVNGFKGMGTAIAANATKLGLVGVALVAVAATGYAVYRSLTADARKLREENDRIGNSVEGWSKLLDFTKLQPGQRRNETTGEAEDTMQSLIRQAREDENLGALVNRLKREGRNIQELRQELYSQAVLLAQQGLKPDQIKQAIEVLLNAANIAPEIKGKLLIEFENFDVAGPDGQPLAQAASSKIEELLGNAEGMTASYWQQQGFGQGGVWSQIDKAMRLGTGTSGVDKNDLSQKAKQEINDIMNNMTQSLDAVATDPVKFAKVFKNWTDSFSAQLDNALKGLKPEAAQKIREAGLIDAELGDMFKDGLLSEDQFNKLVYQQNVMIEVMDRLKERYGGDEKFDFMFENLADASVMAAAQMKQAIMSPTQAADAFSAKIRSMGDEWKNMDEATKISLLNFYRAAAGLEALNTEQAKAALGAGNLGSDIKEMGDKAGAATPEIEALDEELVDKDVDWDLNIQVTGLGNYNDLMDMTLGGYRDAMKQVQDDIFEAAADNAQANFDARMNQLKADQDAALASLDAEADAMDDRYEAEEKAMDKAQDAEKKAFESGWEDRMKAEKQVYEDRIKAIEDAQDAEDDLERQRERNAEREAARIRYLANLMNNNIDMNVAIASGDLDEAARIAINQQQAGTDYQTETANREAGWKKEDDDRARSSAIELIREEEEARMEMLEDQKEMEQEAMESRWAVEKEQFERRRELERADLEAKKSALQEEFSAKQANEQAMYEQQKARMEMELQTLRATLPRTTQEMLAQKAQIEQIYGQYGIQLTMTGDEWAKIIGNSLTQRVNEARNIMSNDAAWKDFGTRVAEGVSRGALDMNSGEFLDFIRTGNMPGLPAPRHEGGPISAHYDKYGSRGGIRKNAPIQSSERIILAKNKEYMLSEKAHTTYGTENLNALNAGRAMIVRHDGGPIGADNLGVLGGAVQAGMMGAVISRVALATGLAMNDAVSSRSYGGGAQDSVGPGMGSSEFIDSMMAVRDKVAPSLSMTSGWRFTDGGYHSKGMAADFSDGGSQTPAMVKFANYIADHYASQTLQLIHHPFNRNIGQQVGFVGDGMGFYGAGTMLGHNDHVHWAINSPVGAGGAGAFAGVSASGSVRAGVSDEIKNKFPQYADWTTAGIEKYRENAKAMFGGMSSNEGNIPFNVSAGVEQWRALGIQMLEMQGQSVDNIGRLLMQMQTESGGNPNAINLWDSNAAKGTPSKGLMQVIDPTFQAYRDPRLPNDIWNPGANIAASIRYTLDRYTTLANGWRGVGYDFGGLAYGKGFMPKNILNPERVLSPQQTRAFEDMVPLLKQKFLNGIIGYDDIIGMLKGDSNLVNAAQQAINSVGQIAKDVSQNIDLKFEINGPVYGVDDLEAILTQWSKETIDKIKKDMLMSERRKEGR